MVTALMPKLSVIVPVYNTKEYLHECIDSILAQTFRDFELILVDDGSTDGSGGICDDYGRQDHRVCVIHQENAGVTAARKRGVEEATGEYIAFVDSDDWIDTNMYSIMLANEPADIVICNMFSATQTGIIEIKFCLKPGTYDKRSLKETCYPFMLFDHTRGKPGVCPSLCDKLIRSDIVKKIIPTVDDRVVYGEDVISSCLCMLEANRVCVVEQALYYYRKDLSSVMDGNGERMFSRLTLLGTEMVRLLSGRDFDAMHQIHGYLAQLSVECIRSELLYHTAATEPKRRSAVLTYLKTPIINNALQYSILHARNRKTKLKMQLILRRRLGLLNVLYGGRYFVWGRRKHEN